jgi:hypothetical protein
MLKEAHSDTFCQITLLTEASNQQIQSILNILYGDSFKHKKNPPKTDQQSTFGLVHQSAPSADPSTFFPDHHMSGWKRKRVTLFLGIDTQRTITEDLGRKEVIKELLPTGWSVFFGKSCSRCKTAELTPNSLCRERSAEVQHMAISHGTARTARPGRSNQTASWL